MDFTNVEKARERLQHYVNDEREAGTYRSDISLMLKCISELEVKNKRLSEALGKYGEHHPDCAFYNYAEDSDCSCGWMVVKQALYKH